MHGYQIMQELADRSGGMWRPSSGSVYPTLQQLEDEGLIQATEATGKRVFELTDSGHAYLNDLGTPAPWEQFAGSGHEGLASLRDSAFQLGAALIQVAASGEDAKVEAARDIVADAKSKVAELLKEED
jgi:DNA-binding PadR family transcriptional regulator